VKIKKSTSLITSSAPEKHKHQRMDESSICAEISVSECLRIIIPAIWDREIEQDCS